MNSPLHLLGIVFLTSVRSDYQVNSVEYDTSKLICQPPHDRLVGVKDHFADMGSNFYIRVKNAAGEWELQRVEGLYRMRHRVQDSEEEPNREQIKAEEQKEDLKKIMKQTLVNEFGTKKKKKTQAQYLESKNDASNISTEKELVKIVEKTVQRQISKEAKEEEKLKEKNSKAALLPAYSLEAENIEEFYDLNSIISPEEMELLQPKELDSLLKKPKLLPKIHNYVRTLVKQLEQKHNSCSRREAQMLLYLNHLLTLYELKRQIRGEIDTIAQRWKIPEIVVKNLVEKFTEAGVDLKTKKVKYVKGAEQQHKLIHFIIVLALFIQDFELNPNELAKALAIKFKTLGLYLKNTYCKPVHILTKLEQDSWSQTSVAKLVIPKK